MPPLLRHHRATVAVAALFAGTPPVAAAPVIIEPVPRPGVGVQGSGRELTFDGDRRLGARCAARPSVTSMTVPAETTVRVVNRTRFRTWLVLDGVARGELPGGAAVEVLFHHGPVVIGLRPLCVFAAESAVRIEVGPPPDDLFGIDPSPGLAPGLPPGPSPGPPPGGPASRPAPGGSGRVESPWVESPSVESPVGSERQRYAWASGLAAEPLSPIEPVRDDGPTGLLALVAAICVVGVAAGAIRAIIAQRSTRTVVS